MIGTVKKLMCRGLAVVMTATASFAVHSCATQTKLRNIRTESLGAQISLPEDLRPAADLNLPDESIHDTIQVVDFEGKKMLLMNAVQDENGDMVAHDVIQAAVVTARFRNVAERHGKVDLEFQITVPQNLRDDRWQDRFYPDMYIMGDTIRLESLILTGKDYRRAQLKGYQQYEKFLSSIIQDTTRFINVWQLELFLERNIPELYSLKTDTTEVSDEAFASIYGATQQEAVVHYTNQIAKRINSRRKGLMGKMYHRYVKSPFLTEGVRLDTIVQNSNGDFVYNYIQTINTRPKLKKVDIVLSGEIWEQGKVLYDIPASEPLTFYISSLSAFVDNTPRYMTKVIERRVEANTACYIDFAQGKADIREDLGFNAEEIGRIKGNLRTLVENETFDLDSITISAFASPEGTLRSNDILSLKRARSSSDYFSQYIKALRDSLRREEGVHLTLGEADPSLSRAKEAPIRFISHSGGENWDMLSRLVADDEQLSDDQKEEYSGIVSSEYNPDVREKALSKLSSYRYLRESLYPRLRIVKFDFYLHRKGMVKDTVHTTVLDSTYMEGVQAIRDRDYEKAITLLRPYNDLNTAVAFVAMDYNASAMNILKDLSPTGQVEYLKAIVYSRNGQIQEAVQCFMNAASADQSYFNRGNLDPEIRALIRRYNLDRRDEEEFDLAY